MENEHELARTHYSRSGNPGRKTGDQGTRIAVEFVVDLLGRGWTAEQVLREYDHLTAQDVQACLAYASDVLKSERVYLLTA